MIEQRFTFLANINTSEAEEQIEVSFDLMGYDMLGIIIRFVGFLRRYGLPLKEIERYIYLGDEAGYADEESEVAAEFIDGIDYKEIEKTVQSEGSLLKFKNQLLESKSFLKSVFRDFLIRTAEDGRIKDV